MSRTDISTGDVSHLGMTRVRGWTTKSDGVTVDPNQTITDRIENRQSSYFLESRTGSTSSGYLNPKRTTPLPYNPFSYERKSVWTSYGESHTYQNVGYGCLQHSWDSGCNAGNAPSLTSNYNSPVYVISSSERTTLDNKARNRLAEKVKDMKVNIAQVIAEREQTTKLFIETVEKVAGAYTAARKGNLIEAASHLGVDISSPRKRARIRRKAAKTRSRKNLDSAANKWLALQFGWIPLLADVKGAAESLADLLKVNRYGSAHTQQVRRSERIEVYTPPTTNRYGGFDSRLVTVKELYSVRYGVRFSSSRTLLSGAAGLGLTNPADLAWELLPFSFVVDWFFPIGQFLSNLDAYLGLTFSDGYCTTFVKQEKVGEGIATGWDTNRVNYRVDVNGRSRFSWVKCNRTKLSSFPGVPYPELKDGITATHIADAMALFNQHIPRK